MKSKNVISLADYRQNKDIREKIARGRAPVYSAFENRHKKGLDAEMSFESRIARIRKKIERINALMKDLRKDPSPRN